MCVRSNNVCACDSVCTCVCEYIYMRVSVCMCMSELCWCSGQYLARVPSSSSTLPDFSGFFLCLPPATLVHIAVIWYCHCNGSGDLLRVPGGALLVWLIVPA